VQLYESIVCLALFAFLVGLARRKRFDGEIILAYTLLYAAARFVLEFFRGDDDRGFVFGGLLSTSQFIGLILFVTSMVLLRVRMRSRVVATR
jgi:phosphatidylglycerol---prolipoprotein diacylglyceryl transferase